MQQNEGKKSLPGYKPYLSGIGAWAFALGASVGWGSLVVTSNTYLAKAGPLGSVIGLVIATAIMLLISKNYHYLINCYPENGGAYTYCKEVLGHDHGFIVFWFLFLVYIAVFWANATSLPLYARFFIGDVFRFGFSYSVFGYEIYLGELLLTFLAITLVALICATRNKAVQILMIILVFVFCIGIAVCAAGSFIKYDRSSFSLSPFFVPEGSRLFQCIIIASISPWAFIGFENISHSAAEFNFPRKKSMLILGASAVSAGIVYIAIVLLSVTAYPSEYGSWMEYINDLGNLSGIKAVPAFYATEHYFGKTGVIILMAALLALVFTTMISNVMALGRLVQSISADGLIPKCFSEITENGVPRKAVLLIPLLSLPVVFMGRTAIGWIVDVTTIGATLVYGFISATAYKMAKNNGEKTEKMTGLAGLICMLVFGVFLLLPNILSVGAMANESYILFTAWSVLGFLFFRGIIKKDKEGKFGRSIIVWISLLSLILLTSLIWMNQSSVSATNRAITTVKSYYDAAGVMIPGEEEFITTTIESLYRNDIKDMSIVVGLFAIALSMLITNYRTMSKRAKEKEEELGHMRNTAYRDSLTGVKSKHAYAEKENEINEMIMHGHMEDFAVIVCDVNGLKHINDTLGHKAGDEYIREACMIVCKVFDHSPVYRTGGDEFVVITTGGDYEHRDALMGKLNTVVEENIGLEKAVLSAGLSEYRPGEDGDMHEVFVRADALMYERKKELKAKGAKTRD